jgi:hypothetical protein
MRRVLPLGLLALTAALLCLPSPLEAARGGGKTEVLPMHKAAPTVVAVETAGSETELRKQLRVKTGVAELPASMARGLFSQAPLNSYGFIAPQALAMVLVAQNPDLNLERAAPAANAFEVHKIADGSALLVGFVGPDLLPQLTPSQRPKAVRIMLYSNPSEKAPHIVAVPLTKLMSDRMPTRLDKKNPDSAVMLEMDLQGTTNKPLSQGAP